jgi:hypothetical protein
MTNFCITKPGFWPIISTNCCAAWSDARRSLRSGFTGGSVNRFQGGGTGQSEATFARQPGSPANFHLSHFAGSINSGLKGGTFLPVCDISRFSLSRRTRQERSDSSGRMAPAESEFAATTAQQEHGPAGDRSCSDALTVSPGRDTQDCQLQMHQRRRLRNSQYARREVTRTVAAENLTGLPQRSVPAARRVPIGIRRRGAGAGHLESFC